MKTEQEIMEKIKSLEAERDLAFSVIPDNEKSSAYMPCLRMHRSKVQYIKLLKWVLEDDK